MQTLSEQILSRAAGRTVSAGDVVTVNVDLVMMHDSLSPSIIRVLHEELGAEQVWNPERVAVVIDHVAPAASVQTAEKQADVRRWARAQGITHFFDVGRGISHPVLVEEGIARPGMVIVGSDSHSTAYGCVAAFGSGMGTTDIALAAATGRTWFRVPETVVVRAHGNFRPGVSAKDLGLRAARELRADGATYAAVEWHGVEQLTVMERMTLATLSIEVGAKAGLVPPTGLKLPVPEWLTLQEDARYSRVIHVDLNTLEPQVAAPHTVDNVTDLSALGRVAVDVVYLGTCTNGHYEDMAAAARLLRGRRLAPGMRMLVVPASAQALQRATEDGTLNTLLAAGATIGTPGCGACIGRHMGVLAPGEVCLFTGNRNFRGRMGSPEAQIYLASPEVAAATALTGYLTHPQELG
ncbi:3-isopropylmalate dehydratase large subunit [Candidatus Viridilinea mediisalina]|uniref:3-isopropylmalate dehydratase large subunit n=1 Tax=Candidatus Viridilinea mediisalina TaxID=2024553 RepID=A0A2A6RK43_9CHLR|nr:3-isopropylmalate dehydratase large subunit [Candidatus Viridilinea mediisalina]PDW03392.1 3-isopropylmalate dehydratase large subunit [Candidatus Viridilinea mediisalina]